LDNDPHLLLRRQDGALIVVVTGLDGACRSPARASGASRRSPTSPTAVTPASSSAATSAT
jgi:hypothetical protein